MSWSASRGPAQTHLFLLSKASPCSFALGLDENIEVNHCEHWKAVRPRRRKDDVPIVPQGRDGAFPLLCGHDTDIFLKMVAWFNRAKGSFASCSGHARLQLPAFRPNSHTPLFNKLQVCALPRPTLPLSTPIPQPCPWLRCFSRSSPQPNE